MLLDKCGAVHSNDKNPNVLNRKARNLIAYFSKEIFWTLDHLDFEYVSHFVLCGFAAL
jgi:hypothetical protein